MAADDLPTAEQLAGALPPASADHGNPGHDLARASARRTQVVTFRLAGMTYEQIAERAGYADRHAARQAVLRALRSVEAESVAELRTIENARLERANAAIWPQVLAGDVSAVRAWLRISERRARLNGLDAPTQVEVSPGVQADLDDALTVLRNVVMGQVTDVRDEPFDDEPGDGTGAG